MNFGQISNRLQRYERAKAKLNEFFVSDNDRKDNKLGQTSSTELLYSTIRVLSQYATLYCIDNDAESLYEDLTFVSHFYETYIEGENSLDYFYLLTGAVSNILSDNFGNAKSLIQRVDRSQEINPIAVLLLEYISVCLGIRVETPYVDEELRECFYYPMLDEIMTGKDRNILKNIEILSNSKLKNNEDEAAFFCLMLQAVHKKFIENSAIRNIPRLTHSTIDDWKKYFSQKKSIKILWQAQRLLLEKEVLSGKDATIQLPTGVGKTRSIELIIASSFLLRNVSLAIVVAPLRALCNEIEKDLQRSLKNIVDITSILDVLEDENIDFGKKQVIVLTPEKLSFLIHHDDDIIKNCGLIIYDEAHMFDDVSRGATYELLIMKINEIMSSESQKVYISAVMPNVQSLNGWLTNNGAIVADKYIKKTEKSVAFFSKDYNRLSFYQQSDLIGEQNEMVFIPQICPRKPDIIEYKKVGKNKGKPKYVFPNLLKSEDVALYLACQYSSKNNCSAIYVNKPSQIFSLASTIVKLKKLNYKLIDRVSYISQQEGNKKVFELAKMHYGENNFVTMMKYGFFPHFGDLENGIRLSIEHEIKKQNIICVICTSTLAEGVNLPIRYLYLTSLKDTFGQTISIRKFQNLIGRTARSGVHTEGSLICTKFNYFDEKRTNESQWIEAISLFDPSKSEHCNSAILQIFNGLKIPYIKTKKLLKGEWLVKKFIENYQNNTVFNPQSFVDEIYQNLVDPYIQSRLKDTPRKAIAEAINSRLFQISNVVDSIENMFLEKTLEEEINVKDFVSKTLAFNLANEEQKEYILALFEAVCAKVTMIPEEKRRVYAKTMNSGAILSRVDEYLIGNSLLYKDLIFNEENWINAILDLSEYYFARESRFLRISKETRKEFLLLWIQGATYIEISNHLNLKIEEVIKICQKDIGYSLNMLISCVVELLEQYKPSNTSSTDWDAYVNSIIVLQERIKYGLAKESEIAAYEYGYSDRVVAKSIGQILEIKTSGKSSEYYKQIMKDCKEEIKEMLKVYPNYFSEVVQL